MGDFESAYDTIQRQRKENADLRRQLAETDASRLIAIKNLADAGYQLATLQREVGRLKAAIVPPLGQIDYPKMVSNLTAAYEALREAATNAHRDVEDVLDNHAERLKLMGKGDVWLTLLSVEKFLRTALAQPEEGGKDG